MFQADPRAYFTQKLITGGIAITVVLVCVIAFTLPHVEPDLWGHVQYGRDFQAKGLPRTTTYSFTAEGHPWINHENLSEITFAGIVDRWGIEALAIFRTWLGLGLAFAFALRAGRAGSNPNEDRKPFSWPVAGGTALVLGLALVSYWQIRPQVLSCSLFAVLICMLSRHQHRLQRDAWLIPVLLGVWANTHGAFLAGLCIFVAYFVFRSVELVVHERRPAARRVVHMALLVLVGALVTLLNPYGWKLHQWLGESLTIPRPEIVEWHPMTWSSEPFMAFAMLTVLSVIGLACSQRRWDRTHVALLAITWWQSVLHQRHFPFFAIMACYWMPVHWDALWERFRTWREKRQTNDSAPLPMLYAIAAVVLAINVTLAFSVKQRWGAVHVDKSEYPVEAMQFIADQNLSGKLVVTYNWAQYAIGCFGSVQPESSAIRVSFDGRFRTCYPLDLIDQHFDFILGNHPQMPRHRHPSSPPPDPSAILRRAAPNLVLISRKQPHSTRVMQEHGDEWCLLYQDRLAQLWGRRTAHDDPEQPEYVAQVERSISDRAQTGVVSWPALPISHKPRSIATSVADRDPTQQLLTWRTP